MGLPLERLTLAEYLAWENEQAERHEFYEGEVFAMVGGRRIHALVVDGLHLKLKTHLKGTGCAAFSESMKLQAADNKVLYPDIFVTCDESDLKTEMVFHHATLVVEVLSESTESYDRGKKLFAYRAMPSIREYLLIDPDTREVTLFRRNERGNFELLDQTGHAELVLESVDLRLPMAEVFEDVEDVEG